MKQLDLFPRARRQRLAIFLLIPMAAWTWMAAILNAEVHTVADLSELAGACRPLQDFLSANAVLVGQDLTQVFLSTGNVSFPFPPRASVVASEGNTNFFYACAEMASCGGALPANGSSPATAKWTRRFLYLRPGVFVVDDFVQPSMTNLAVQWIIKTVGEPATAGQKLRLTNSDQALTCETLWPLNSALAGVSGGGSSDCAKCVFGLRQPSGAADVRFLHVLSLGSAKDRPSGERSMWGRLLESVGFRHSDSADPRAKAVRNGEGELEWEISTREQTMRLELPSPSAGAGWIAVSDSAGNPIMPRRPLPSGNLPGDLVEVWDSPFRSRRAAEWDKGGPALKLQRLAEQGEIKPCRVLDLGCGSGNDAIYLAAKGFDVTALDISPTALSMAAEKAKEAGVRVNWVLADALQPPDMEPFDFIFDRGCYHNVRYVNASRFTESLGRLTRPGSRCLILSINRDGPPGVREHHMREDFSPWFEIVRLENGGIEDRAGNVLDSWSLMLRRGLSGPRPSMESTSHQAGESRLATP